MDYGQLYGKYYSRMSKEGWLKSLLCALAIGFAVNGIIALVTWLVGFGAGFWIALGGLVVVTAAAMPVFYSRLFRPTEKTVAKRLDSFGLDERIITMQELQGDDSEIANIQRADAVDMVEKTESSTENKKKVVRLKMPIPIVVAVACVGVFGVTFSIVTALSGYGVIGSGKDMLSSAFANPTTYTVTYGIYGDEEKKNDKAEIEVADKEKLAAMIAYALAANNASEKGDNEVPARVSFGDVKQNVEEGGSSKEIMYTANDYYYFVKWIDNFGNEYGYEDGYTPSRHEDNVSYDIELKVQFDRVSECIDDGNLKRYFDSSSSDSSGGGGGGSSNNPGNMDIELNRFDFIIDGQTKYGKDYDMYYDIAMKYLSGSDNLSGEERAMIETYFDTLK